MIEIEGWGCVLSSTATVERGRYRRRVFGKDRTVWLRSGDSLAYARLVLPFMEEAIDSILDTHVLVVKESGTELVLCVPSWRGYGYPERATAVE